MFRSTLYHVFSEPCTAELMNCCKGFRGISSLTSLRKEMCMMYFRRLPLFLNISTIDARMNRFLTFRFLTWKSDMTCWLLLIVCEENIAGMSASPLAQRKDVLPSTLTLTLLDEVTSRASSRLLFLRIIQCGEK